VQLFQAAIAEGVAGQGVGLFSYCHGALHDVGNTTEICQ
jgi:hypothetical protein